VLLVLTVLNLEVGSNRSWYYTVESSKAAMPEFMSVTLRPVPPKMPPPPGLVERIMWERSVSRVSQALGDSSDSGGRLCPLAFVLLGRCSFPSILPPLPPPPVPPLRLLLGGFAPWC
jgi:hypothetical protein